MHVHHKKLKSKVREALKSIPFQGQKDYQSCKDYILAHKETIIGAQKCKRYNWYVHVLYQMIKCKSTSSFDHYMNKAIQKRSTFNRGIGSFIGSTSAFGTKEDSPTVEQS